MRRLSRELSTKGVNQPVQGELPLRVAASYSYEMTLLLLNAGADSAINARLPMLPGTALQAAAAAGKEDVVKLLLDKGVMIDGASPYWNAPLSSAAEAGHERLLLDRGAFIQLGWGKVETPLEAAVLEATSTPAP